MGFFLCFVVSLAGFILMFLPVEIPLHVAPALAATGWVLARMLEEKTPTDRRLRRISGWLALATALVVLAWYALFWVLAFWQSAN